MGSPYARGERGEGVAPPDQGPVEFCALGAGVLYLRKDRAAGYAATGGGAQGDRRAPPPGGDARAQPLVAVGARAARHAFPKGPAAPGDVCDAGRVCNADVRVLSERTRAGPLLLSTIPRDAAAPGLRLRGDRDAPGVQTARRRAVE